MRLPWILQDTTHLHQSGVAKAASRIGERISDTEVGALTSFLVVDTKDHEALIGDRVNEVLAFYDNGVGSGDRGGERAESGEVACELYNGQICVSLEKT